MEKMGVELMASSAVKAKDMLSVDYKPNSRSYSVAMSISRSGFGYKAETEGGRQLCFLFQFATTLILSMEIWGLE